jgi:hypothetical protein
MTQHTDHNPAEYRRNYARRAEKLTLVGATRAELALFCGVDVRTIERWAEEHKDFEWALQVAPSILSVTGEDIGLFNWLKDYRLGNLDI